MRREHRTKLTSAELARQLKETLEEAERVTSRMQTQLRYISHDRANQMAVNNVGATGKWLYEEFKQWLR